MENNNLTWVSKAVSKDKFRGNLRHVYRDKNAVVASDGHRLHYSNGLPDATPHFIDGYDGEFPDYKRVLVAADQSVATVSLTVTKELLDGLTACHKAMVAFGKPFTTLFLGNSMRLDLRAGGYVGSVVVVGAGVVGEPVSVGLNLGYLVDALKMPGQLLTISIYGPDKPIEITNNCGQTAIIMPMKGE